MQLHLQAHHIAVKRDAAFHVSHDQHDGSQFPDHGLSPSVSSGSMDLAAVSRRFTCFARTSLAVNSATNFAGAAPFSTLARPPASSRSTRQSTPAIANPNSRAASMAWVVDRKSTRLN